MNFFNEELENIVEDIILSHVLQSQYINDFVEVHHCIRDGINEFRHDGGTLCQTKFEGIRWQNYIDHLQVGEKCSLEKEWLFIEGADYYLDNPDKMKLVVEHQVELFFYNRMHRMFEGLLDDVSDRVCRNGSTDDDINRFCEYVKSYSMTQDVTIFGTQRAFRKMDDVFEMLEMHNMSRIAIPKGLEQPHKLDNKLFILPSTLKPLKFDFVGDTRSKLIFNENNSKHEYLIQTKVALGLFASYGYGIFTFNE